MNLYCYQNYELFFVQSINFKFDCAHSKCPFGISQHSILFSPYMSIYRPKKLWITIHHSTHSSNKRPSLVQQDMIFIRYTHTLNSQLLLSVSSHHASEHVILLNFTVRVEWKWKHAHNSFGRVWVCLCMSMFSYEFAIMQVRCLCCLSISNIQYWQRPHKL